MSHKTVSLVINAGDPIDLSQLAKKESMDTVERWIISISHTVRMIDFHQQEYRMLHDRHLKSKFNSIFCGVSSKKMISIVCSLVSDLVPLSMCFNILSNNSAVKSTNKRVKWWSFLECLAVMAVSATQVMFIKKMFNKGAPGMKRMV